ncbi:hypothetical protein [Phenylobacterium sp.]|jgi:hypothetical protein
MPGGRRKARACRRNTSQLIAGRSHSPQPRRDVYDNTFELAGVGTKSFVI